MRNSSGIHSCALEIHIFFHSLRYHLQKMDITPYLPPTQNVLLDLCLNRRKHFSKSKMCKTLLLLSLYYVDFICKHRYLLQSLKSGAISLAHSRCSTSVYEIYCLAKCSTCFSFNRLYIFNEVLGSQQNWGENTEFLYSACSHTCTDFSTINMPHQSGTFITIDEPTLTYHYHPKSIVYIRVHS